MSDVTVWKRYQQHWCPVESVGLSLDISRMGVRDRDMAELSPRLADALAAMQRIEQGAVANIDEHRRVGHYWLRAPHLAPEPQIATDIQQTLARIKAFAADLHAGRIRPAAGGRFTHLLLIGIGGSALGPMLVADALGDPSTDLVVPAFLDNTDPDGIARTLRTIGPLLLRSLCVVVSKSGGTPETANAMILAAAAFREAGLDFARQTVAITAADSQLDRTAQSQGWLARFPMWDWVGGRTSVTSAVGLLPAAIQGLDVDGFLAGAARCDEATRQPDPLQNPAALLAAAWHHATAGRGERNMVLLPYKDRLLLLGRYLQQLVMESLGKQLDRKGRTVEQGLTVFGNKGSTDQHAYVQQLRDGRNDFFVTFVRVLETGDAGIAVAPGVFAGDYLHAFLLGTRAALSERGRPSLTITLKRVDAPSLGALIALFERAVGLYAELIDVNAYHQPGVEAGKKAAAATLNLQRRIVAALSAEPRTAEQVAEAVGTPGSVEEAFLILEHLAANGQARLAHGRTPGEMAFTSA